MIAFLVFLASVGGMVAFGPADQWPDVDQSGVVEGEAEQGRNLLQRLSFAD